MNYDLYMAVDDKGRLSISKFVHPDFAEPV